MSPQKPTPHQEQKQGLIAATIAFMTWGGLPLFWRLLYSVPPLEIICNRIVWSTVILFLTLLAVKKLRSCIEILRTPKLLLQLILSSAFLTSNWFAFIWAINNGKTIETSLGYYINPLLNVLVGMIVFKEKGSRASTFALILAFVGVMFLIISRGQVPWVALWLGFSFCTYGVIRKVAAVDALPGLFIETALCLPVAAGYLMWLSNKGISSFGLHSPEISLYLIIAGFMTTFPMILFTYGARRIRLTSLAMIQYIAPSCTFLIGVLLFKEPFTFASFVTFACIWLAIGIYTADSLYKQKTLAKIVKRHTQK